MADDTTVCAYLALNNNVVIKAGMYTCASSTAPPASLHTVLKLNKDDTVRLAVKSAVQPFTIKAETSFSGAWLSATGPALHMALATDVTMSGTTWKPVTGMVATGDSALFAQDMTISSGAATTTTAGYYYVGCNAHIKVEKGDAILCAKAVFLRVLCLLLALVNGGIYFI